MPTRRLFSKSRLCCNSILFFIFKSDSFHETSEATPEGVSDFAVPEVTVSFAKSKQDKLALVIRP